MGIRPGSKGEVSHSEIAWSEKKGVPGVPSPLYYNGRLYTFQNGGIVYCRNAKTGELLYSGRIDNPNLDGDRTVEMFVEKPSADAAKMMMRKGALWNMFVLVVTCKTLLQAIKRAAPELYCSFETIEDAIGTPDEQRVTERVYQRLPSLNFSKGVLEVLRFEQRRALRVLPVRGVTWNDWGTADHLSKSLRVLSASEHVQSVRMFETPSTLGIR